MYEIILFDLDDTLLDFGQSERESLKRIHAEFYSQLDFPIFEESFMNINRALWSRVGTQADSLTPSEIRLRRFIEFNQKYNIHHDHISIADNYEKHLGETADWLPGVKEAVENLHKKDYLLGIVTNGLVSVQYKKHERHELAKWFQSFVVSDKVNITKPHKGIFELALTELKVLDLTKVLMVGDSLQADGHGAKNAGIDFCLVGQGSPEEIHRAHGIPVRYSIPSVCELPQILGR